MTAEGSAFPALVKALATVLVAALAVWAVRAADQLMTVEWPAAALAFLGVATALIVLCWVWILRSRTSVTPTHIRQTWIWRKEVALADVAHVKLVAIPRLDWLIAPRIVVRARGRGVMVFHAADRSLLQVFALMSLTTLPGAAPRR